MLLRGFEKELHCLLILGTDRKTILKTTLSMLIIHHVLIFVNYVFLFLTTLLQPLQM